MTVKVIPQIKNKCNYPYVFEIFCINCGYISDSGEIDKNEYPPIALAQTNEIYSRDWQENCDTYIMNKVLA